MQLIHAEIVASHILVGLVPVLGFLATLFYLDSYKLVKLGWVVAIVGCGAVVAGVAYFINAWILDFIRIDITHFSRYIAPITEELAKALVIVALIRFHRIGFLVDATIFGFAVGTGFAMVENRYFLRLIPEAGLGTWLVRGFGTALMHGGTTAIFGVVALAMIERTKRANVQALFPGFVLAVLLHSGYNHLSHSPHLST